MMTKKSQLHELLYKEIVKSMGLHIRLAANLYKLNTMKTFQNIFWKTMSVLPIFVQCMYIHYEIFLSIAIMFNRQD